MRIVHPRSGGIDIHKRRIAVCGIWTEPDGKERSEQQEFGTYTSDLLRLVGWLREREIVDLAMEATGPYWRPVWNILEEAGMRLTLANPSHIRAIPGHKTDRRDARWIADLHRYGLVPRSYVPSREQRQFRDLTRMRTKVVEDHTRVVSRIQALLEDANIKLGSVVSDIFGVSARAMLQALIAGKQSAAEMAELAKGSLQRKKANLRLALEGCCQPHHRFLLRRLLLQESQLRAQERVLSEEIRRRLGKPQRAAVALWDTLPGVNQKVAAVLVAEMGIRTEQFPDAAHLASWAGLCPGNHESAGISKSGRTRKGNRWLRTALVEAAWAAVRTNGTYLAAFYRRLVPRKGARRALVAVAHAILVAAYHMLKTGQSYRDPGADHFDNVCPERTVHSLVVRLAKLGYKADITALDANATHPTPSQ